MHGIDEAADHLRGLKELGLKLAIDDFGTGFSSMAHLRQIPIDLIKIDKSFIDGMGVDAARKLNGVFKGSAQRTR